MAERVTDWWARQRIAGPAMLVVLITLGAIIAYQCFSIGALLWLRSESNADYKKSPTLEQWAAGTALQSGQSLARWHLLGQALVANDMRSIAQSAPDTTLNLVLKGIVSAEDPKKGWVIIADGQNVDRRYVVGDAIGSDVTLDSIYSDRVILSRAGVLETLRLPKSQALNAGQASTTTSQTTQGSTTQNATTPYVQSPISLGGVDWNQTSAKLGVDVKALAQQVTVLPVIENGQIVGVRLQGSVDTPLVSRLGLQADDVVTAINGIALDSPSKAQAVAQSLATANSATVTIRRNGKIENLKVGLR
jgi:general secretion pathway protein C